MSNLDTNKTAPGGGAVLDKSISGGYTEHRKGAAGGRLAPGLDYRSNRLLGGWAVTSFYWPE